MRMILNCGICGRFVGNSCPGCCQAAQRKLRTGIHKPVCREHFGVAMAHPEKVAP